MEFLERKVRIGTLLDFFIYGIFYIIIVATVWSVTISHIEHKRLKVEIQKRDAQISAFVLTGKIDPFIKRAYTGKKVTLSEK